MPKQKKSTRKAARKISIGILEDNIPLIKGMMLELDKPGMEVCVATDNLEEFYSTVVACRPRIAIIDIRIWQDFEAGYAAIKKLHEISPETLCVIYTVYDKLEDFHKGISLGVRAFVSKNINEISLEKVVHIVDSGGTYYGEFLPEYFDKVKDKIPALTFQETIPNTMQIGFSRREIDTLQLLGQGLKQGDIAKRLTISINTVKVHTRSIRKKLGVDSTPEAVRIARIRRII